MKLLYILYLLAALLVGCAGTKGADAPADGARHNDSVIVPAGDGGGAARESSRPEDMLEEEGENYRRIFGR